MQSTLTVTEHELQEVTRVWLVTLSFVYEGEKSREPQNCTEDEAGGDRDVRNCGESLEGAVAKGSIDQVGVVVADKGYNNKNNVA